MTSFYYQKGPIITRENWVFPTEELVNSFIDQYIPEFKRIFKGDSNYELYFFGSCRDRLYGYKQPSTMEYSNDVDFIILTTHKNPDTTKIYEALYTAVKIGFDNKILIDISCQFKPYYTDYNDFHYYTLLNFSIPRVNYRLNPVIKIVDDFYYENYINNSKEFLVKEERQIYTTSKIYNKICNGWYFYNPTKII